MNKCDTIGYKLLKLYPGAILKVGDFVRTAGGINSYDAWPEYWEAIYEENLPKVQINEIYKDIRSKETGAMFPSMIIHAMTVSCHKIIEIIAEEMCPIGRIKDEFIERYKDRVV